RHSGHTKPLNGEQDDLRDALNHDGQSPQNYCGVLDRLRVKGWVLFRTHVVQTWSDFGPMTLFSCPTMTLCRSRRRQVVEMHWCRLHRLIIQRCFKFPGNGFLHPIATW